MKRRELIALLGGSAAAWPLRASAQQPSRTRHIAVLLGGLEQGDVEGLAELAAFNDGLKQAGWNVGANIEVDYRWPGADPNRLRAVANEVADTHPDLVLTRSTPATAPLMSMDLPVVFTLVSDPLGSRFIQSYANPGGHITGFTNVEPSVGSKWLSLLKEAAPRVTHIALLFNPQTAPYVEVYFHAAEQAAQTLSVVLNPTPVRNVGEIDTTLAALAGDSGGFFVMPDISMADHHDLLIELAARHHLPAIYPSAIFVPHGGLMSYVVDYPDIFRRAASYVDLILKGTKPADLPVQLPTRFQLALNLKTAKSLGLSFPQTLLAIADEVIE